MNQYLKHFCYGWVILIVAIIVNFLVKLIGISTWYDLLNGSQIPGVLSFIFLFIIYPGIFGVIIYLLKK